MAEFVSQGVKEEGIEVVVLNLIRVSILPSGKNICHKVP